MSQDEYFKQRLGYDEKRKTLWKTLVRYFFSGIVAKDRPILELGAGYCDFINHIESTTKIAIDSWSGFEEYASPQVETYVGSVTSLEFIETQSVGTVFASNLFEHLTQAEFIRSLSEIFRVLQQDGKLIILQPNYKYSYKNYFDDYTHVSIWTDISIVDFLKANKFEIIQCYPKFLPLSIKSKFPVAPVLIWLYLRLPFKLMAGQMLIIARPKR